MFRWPQQVIPRFSPSSESLNFSAAQAAHQSVRAPSRVSSSQLSLSSSTVVCYTNAQTGARTPSLLNLSQSLLSWFSVHFLSPRATHAGAGLSLQAGTPEGGMNITPFTSGQLWDLFVEAKVDLFATRVKTYCPHSSLQLTTTQPFPSEDSGQGATNLLRGTECWLLACVWHTVFLQCAEEVTKRDWDRGC